MRTPGEGSVHLSAEGMRTPGGSCRHLPAEGMRTPLGEAVCTSWPKGCAPPGKVGCCTAPPPHSALAAPRPPPTHLLGLLGEGVGRSHHHVGAGVRVLRQVDAGHPLIRREEPRVSGPRPGAPSTARRGTAAPPRGSPPRRLPARRLPSSWT